MDNRTEEEDIMGSEEEEEESEGEEEVMESEEEYEEEAERLEEMRSPVVASWTGPDGITVRGILVIDDNGINRLMNRCQFDDCSICFSPPTAHGKHQICCLPCGHMYGFSCIKKWLLQSSSSGKCPQCNTLCSFEDAILLYPPHPCVTAHQKASSATLFPFTKQGYLEFVKHELRHRNNLARHHNDLAKRGEELTTKWYNLSTRAVELEERAESLGRADALCRRADALRRRADALLQRLHALNRRLDALKWLLRRPIDVLKQRSDAYESWMTFYVQMYKEHHKTKN